MFAKRTIFASLVVAALVMLLASLSFAQTYYELYNDDGTDGCGYATFPANGFIWAKKMQPAYQTFKIDSVKFYAYRYSGATATLTFKIHLYEDTAWLVSDSCLGDPGDSCNAMATATQRWVSPANLVTPALVVNTPKMCTFNVPDCTFTRDFIIGIEVCQAASEPSLMMDCQTSIPCCVNFYRYNNAWYEQYDLWMGGDAIGYNLIRCKGWGMTPIPGALAMNPHQIEFGHTDITYGGGEETVPDSIGFTNTGGAALTISSVTTTAPLNFLFNAAEVTGALNAGQTKYLHVDFTTTVPEPTPTVGDIIVTHTGSNGPTDTCSMSGQGFGGHWIENWMPYPENVPGPAESGDWFNIQYNCTTSTQNYNWGIYIDAGYANAAGMHWPTVENSGCMAEDMLFSSPIKNPGNSLKVRWWNYEYYNDLYYYQALYYTSPNDTLFHLVSEISPTPGGYWTEVGPYYVVTDSDSVMLAYYYAGENATRWGVDDILVDSLPPQPPILTHEHHSDEGPATWPAENCTHITVQALDPNNDLSWVKLWYKDAAGGSWASLDMAAVTGCEYMNLWEVMLCDIMVCHRYLYYFEANDVAATGPSYNPVGAPTNYYTLDVMDNTTDQIAYDDGGIYYVQLFYDFVGRFAARMTPPSYPYALGGAMVVIGSPYQGFPDADHEDVVCEIYDDNGVNNLPGTLMYGPDAGGTSWNPGAPDCDDFEFASWVYFKIDPCVIIPSGDFYISFRNRDGSVSPDMDAFGFDDDGPGTPYRSYCFYPTGGGGGFWGPDTLTDPNEAPASDLMVRALGCSCIPSAPTNVTVIYNAATSNAELRWVDNGQNQSYKIYRSTTSPFAGFTLLATVGTGIQLYLDPIGANTKAFYQIQGSCDPAAFTPPAPPSEPMMSAVGPVRVPGAGRTASLAVGQKWTALDQLQSGVLPKTLSKTDLVKITRSQLSPTHKLLEQFAK